MLDWESYRRWVLTKIGTPVACSALGLCGEAGELTDLIKKDLFHGVPADLKQLRSEAGDVFFYLTHILSHYNISLESVVAANIHKLDARYPGGFTQGGGIRKEEV
jgi:NTP pyrophosphatase (non-canonical NTP hydrolase)